MDGWIDTQDENNMFIAKTMRLKIVKMMLMSN